MAVGTGDLVRELIALLRLDPRRQYRRIQVEVGMDSLPVVQIEYLHDRSIVEIKEPAVDGSTR